jgi:hypothetical protein
MVSQPNPAYEVRRLLWIAYGVLAAGLILFFTALILIGHHQFGTLARPLAPPSASAAPSGSPTAINPAPSANPPGQIGDSSPSGSLTRTGYPPGEPPGDVEDDQPTPPAQAATMPAPNAQPGVSLPQLPLPVPPAVSVRPSLPPLR